MVQDSYFIPTIDELVAAYKKSKWKLIEVLQELKGDAKVGIGLGGGSNKFPLHIGVLKYLEEEGIQIDEIIGVSSGAIVGALYFVFREKYGNLAAHQMESYLRKLLEGKKLFEFLGLSKLPDKGGFIKPSLIDKVLEENLGDRIFHHATGLYVVAHDLISRRDIVFGEVEKDYPIRKGVKGSYSIPLFFQPFIDEEKNFVLVDGGTIRKSPFLDLYSHRLTVRICVFLGYDTAPQLLYPHKVTGWERIRVGKRLKGALAQDLMGAQMASADREVHDLKLDARLTTGRSEREIRDGKQPGLVLITPNHEYLSLTEGIRPEMVDAGYQAAKKAFEAYRKARPSYIKLIRQGGALIGKQNPVLQKF
ncbi:patatin-like phospholipase family protein [Candidatus Woesearchaeota archaeon]|nr:patatin-like phospholipase family protein [Candidatus Woesearchaeota archaeon]